MIRLLSHKDYDSIRNLWLSVYPNEADEIENFFREYPRPLGWVNQEQSMINSFVIFTPCSYERGGVSSPCWNLYKCATRSDSRHRGYMSKLLSEAEATAQEKKIEGIIVVPTSEQASVFFKNRGFQLFSKKKVVMCEGVKTISDFQLSNISSHQLHSAHKRMFGRNGLMWTIHYANFIASQVNSRNAFMYSFMYYNMVGTIVCHRNGNVLVVEELTARIQHKGRLEKVDLQSIANGLSTALDVKTICYNMPEMADNYGKIMESSLVKSGTMTYSPDNYVYLG